MNPVFWLDMRVRVRERRLWVIALFFLAMPLLICGLAMASALETNQRPLDPGDVGEMVALCAIFCQAGLLVILSPLAAAQRISQEREQRTYAALVNSPLGAGAIARGKLLGAWMFTVWLGVLHAMARLVTVQVLHLCAEKGGKSIYLPKGVAAYLSARDLQMCSEFTGNNYDLLARRYGLTEMRVRQIVNDWQKEQFRTRQGRLPGIDD